MPCSCGNTICSCGIPCYCSEESCECHDCAIALPNFCKICNKPLIAERRTDEDMCSCFVVESTALILENRENPNPRLGNISTPIGYFVHGKLAVNVMIPIPVLRFPQFIPQQPFCLMPSIEDHTKISVLSRQGVLKPFFPEDSNFFTSQVHRYLRKCNRQSSDNSSGYSSNCEQNAEMSYQNCPPPLEFLQSADNSHTVNAAENTQSETEDYPNIQEKVAFYLPSVTINNISHPLRIMDPIWRLPNPSVRVSADPTLNLVNPFVTGSVHATQTVATYENQLSPLDLSLTFETNDMQCFPENKDNVQAESAISSLQMNGQTLEPTKTSEQSNLVINGENVECTVSSNNDAGNECTALPSLGNSNAVPLSEQCEISSNCLMPAQSSCVTSASGNNYSLLACPDISTTANHISDNVYPESTGERWQEQVKWCSPLPEIPVVAGSIPPMRTFPISRHGAFSNRYTEGNERLQRSNPSSVSANRNKENIPLYVDTCTTEKMEKFMKPTLKLNGSSPVLAENVP